MRAILATWRLRNIKNAKQNIKYRSININIKCKHTEYKKYEKQTIKHKIIKRKSQYTKQIHIKLSIKHRCYHRSH